MPRADEALRRGAERPSPAGPKGRWATARVLERTTRCAPRRDGRGRRAAAPAHGVRLAQGRVRAAPARRLAAGRRARAAQRAAGLDPRRRDPRPAPSTSRCTSTAPPAGCSVRRGARVLRRVRVAVGRPGTRDADAAASRSRTSCARSGPTRPTAAARSRSRATRPSCCRAGRAATGSRSTRRRSPRRSARRPRSAACAPRRAICRRILQIVPLGAPVFVSP